jgi:hypothetical protein
LDIDSIKSYSVGEIILRYGSISSIAQLESDISNGMLQCVSPWSMWISEITQHEFSIYFSVITIVSIILCAVLFFKAVFFGIISLKKLLRRVLNVNKYFNEFDEILYGNFLGAKREMDGLFIKVFFSVTDFLLALGFAYISVHFSTVKTGYNLINSVVIIGVSSLWIGLIVLILLLAIGSFILVRFEEKKIMERR